MKQTFADVMQVEAASGIELLVMNDIARRQQLGIAKYGQTVANNPLELRAWLHHAYEEALDMAVYLRRSIDELDRSKLVHRPSAEKSDVPLSLPPKSD